jgi:AraC-like DNA-binding protein
MTDRGTVSCMLVRRILAASAVRGADPLVVARDAGVGQEVLEDPNARAPQHTLVAVWDAAARHAGDPAFGIHCAELSRQMPANALAFATATSASLGVALETIGRYIRIAHDAATLRTRVERGLARVDLALAPGLAVNRHGIEFALTLVALIARQHVGAAFVLRDVVLAHDAPPSTAAHERVFGRVPRFGQRSNELVFDAALLEHAFDEHDPALHAHLARHLDQLVAALDELQDLRARVQKLVTEQLRGGAPDMDVVARKLALSPRTLQRKLQQEGTSFQEVVNAARRDVALRYLGEPTLSLTEVAFLLGFTEPTNFHRAFKRWTGTTPAEARRRALQGGGANDATANAS